MKVLKEKVEKPPKKTQQVKKVGVLDFFDSVINKLEGKGNIG